MLRNKNANGLKVKFLEQVIDHGFLKWVLTCFTCARPLLNHKISTLFLYISLNLFTVMILGALLANKKYPLIKYLCVLLIVIGVALFLYKDVSTSCLLHYLKIILYLNTFIR